MPRYGSADRKPAGFWKSTEVHSILEKYVHGQIDLNAAEGALRKLLPEGFEISVDSLKEDVKWYARETRKRLAMFSVRAPQALESTSPAYKQTVVTPVHTLSAAQLADLRRELLRVLDLVDRARDRQGESVAARIGRLSKAGLIPRQVAACMRTITEVRNVAEYDAKTPSPAETTAVEASWTVVKEWATSRGLKLPGWE